MGIARRILILVQDAKNKPVSTSAQSGHYLCYLLSGKYNRSTCYMQFQCYS